MTPYYQHDGITLYHGDCRQIDAWLTADVLVTDPPYGMAYESNFNRDKRNIKVGRPVAADGATNVRDSALAMWGAERPALVFGTWQAQRPATVREVAIWDKGVSPGMGDLNLPVGPAHEEIYVIGRWPTRPMSGRLREGGRPGRIGSVIRVAPYNSMAQDRPDHPTPKPVGLLERLVDLCPPGVIADPFAGSGPTLVAAQNQGRQAIGVELEERYCELIAQRLAQQPLFV